MAPKARGGAGTHLAVLHNVQLPEPRMVERVAGRVYNVTQPILLREHQHCVQKTLHRIDRADECRPAFEFPSQLNAKGQGLEYSQLVRLVYEEHGNLLGRGIRLLLLLPVFLLPCLAISAPCPLSLLPAKREHAFGPGRAVALLFLVLLVPTRTGFRLALSLERVRRWLEVPVAEEGTLGKWVGLGCEVECEESS